jgi:Peptidase A4 family
MPHTFSGAAGRRLILTLTLSAALGAGAPAIASASPVTGKLLKLVHVSSNTNTSDNWFGYDQGALAGGKLFSSIAGNWTVPTATQHTSGQAEDSADWIGIGGGCVDSGCSASDETLIQTGTEQDVSATGAASYDAWYELVPVPELEISSLTVEPGDQMHAAISSTVPGLWTITIADLTRNESYSTTVPYSSTEDTAEWIEETPLEIGTDAGFAALPNLTDPAFTDAQTNGSPADLTSSEEIQLTDSSGNVIGTPSAPNAAGNGFSECTWTSICS